MDLLKPGTGLLFWQVVVFLGLVLILGKYAWKPILNALRDREDSIKNALDAADQAKREMDVLKAENENLLREARMERDKIMREAHEMAARLRDEAQQEGKKRGEELLAETLASIRVEKQRALKEIKNQVATFSIEIAEKIIRKNISSDKAQKELAEKYVDDLKMN